MFPHPKKKKLPFDGESANSQNNLVHFFEFLFERGMGYTRTVLKEEQGGTLPKGRSLKPTM